MLKHPDIAVPDLESCSPEARSAHQAIHLKISGMIGEWQQFFYSVDLFEYYDHQMKIIPYPDSDKIRELMAAGKFSHEDSRRDFELRAQCAELRARYGIYCIAAARNAVIAAHNLRKYVKYIEEDMDHLAELDTPTIRNKYDNMKNLCELYIKEIVYLRHAAVHQADFS